MIKGIYDVASGMMPRLTKQDVISNNIANSNTIGFKRDRVFIKALNKAAAANIPMDFDWQEPLIEEPMIDFSQGMLDRTEYPLDVAIEGSGFFVVNTDNGIRYTRNGQFHVDTSGLLVDARGNSVMSESGPITLESASPSIDETGNITVNGESVAALMVVDFANPQQLTREDGVNFAAPAGAGTIAAANAKVRQGFLENANSSILEQMVDMISSYRNFETGQMSIMIQDETVDKSINRIGRPV